MSAHETPQSLYNFFQALDAGNAEDADKCEMHYGCACIVHRARRAAEMLMDIQTVLGLEDVEPVAAPAAPAAAHPAAPEPVPADPSPAIEKLTSQLQEEQTKLHAIGEEVTRLTRDNDRLRDHIRLLQRQLDRLYDRRELNNVLSRIENGRDPNAIDSANQTPLPQETPAEPVIAPIKSAAKPAKPAHDHKYRGKRPPSTLAETIETEGAMPVRALPPEQRNQDDWGDARHDEHEFPDD